MPLSYAELDRTQDVPHETTANAVVLLSGGQDSTTCFYDALNRYDAVAAVSVDYGQRHRVELALAAETAANAGVPHRVFDLPVLQQLAGASLTNRLIENTVEGAPASEGWHAEHGLPPSFVPGRNLLFFTVAAAYGIPRGFHTLVSGVCETDRAGYPDCREEFVLEMRSAIRLGMDEPDFHIDTPLMHLSKAETWGMAARLGIMDEIVENTATCYEGDRDHFHEWGYGCGVCGACTERARGYTDWILKS